MLWGWCLVFAGLQCCVYILLYLILPDLGFWRLWCSAFYIGVLLILAAVALSEVWQRIVSRRRGKDDPRPKA
jgi:hypothetical protein